MRFLTLIVGILCIPIISKAQAGAAEFMVGDKYLHYQHSVAMPFNQTSRFGWQHIATLIKHHKFGNAKADLKDELMNQAYLTANLSKAFQLKGGVFYNDVGGYRLSTGIQFAAIKPNWMFVINPRLDLDKVTAYEVFMVSEFTPPINDRLRFYSRIQLMSNINRNQHLRSYQLIRVGISKDKFQMGAGVTLDEYGKDGRVHYNTGFFVRKEF
ncbi:MAG TPA: hypothetical protein VD794_03165 [Flavisolibacter sp.]|nr:hypothetical protein [Flavisolibacter sp.]